MPPRGRRRGRGDVPVTGDLRDWLEVLQPTITLDASRAPVEGVPTVVARVPAYIEALEGDERLQGAQLASALQWRIYVRHLQGVTARQQVRVLFTHSGEQRLLEILSVRPVRPHWTEILGAELA
jgi:head-tail adaptor